GAQLLGAVSRTLSPGYHLQTHASLRSCSFSTEHSRPLFLPLFLSFFFPQDFGNEESLGTKGTESCLRLPVRSALPLKQLELQLGPVGKELELVLPTIHACHDYQWLIHAPAIGKAVGILHPHQLHPVA